MLFLLLTACSGDVEADGYADPDAEPAEELGAVYDPEEIPGELAEAEALPLETLEAEAEPMEIVGAVTVDPELLTDEERVLIEQAGEETAAALLLMVERLVEEKIKADGPLAGEGLLGMPLALANDVFKLLMGTLISALLSAGLVVLRLLQRRLEAGIVDRATFAEIEARVIDAEGTAARLRAAAEQQRAALDRERAARIRAEKIKPAAPAPAPAPTAKPPARERVAVSSFEETGNRLLGIV